MEVEVSVAKVGKYASSESGDTVEMVERPGGGLSFVVVDGQRSGKSAKAISNVVARKAISLLAEGVRDGAAARAASDYLHTYRGGKVLATLNILSIDLDTQTLVITRNNPVPVVLVRQDQLRLLSDPSEVVGIRRAIRPAITEVALEPGLAVVIYTDGLSHAGEAVGTPMDVPGCVTELMSQGPADAGRWAEYLLQRGMQLDRGRPTDDITVLVAAILPPPGDEIRRLSVRMRL